VLATFDSTIDAGAAVLALARAGVVARCIELLDAYCCAVLREDAPSVLPPHANVVLLIEFDGTERECEAQLERAGQVLLEAHATDVFVARHSGDRERLWASRKVLSRALRARARWKLSEDIVVPRSKLAAMLDEVRTLSERESIAMPTYGHAGDGNLHVNFLWNDPSERPRVQRAIHALFERAIAHGGTLSGEHGIGTLKRDYLCLEQAPALIEAQRSIKRALDPHNLLNPYKVLPTPGHRAC
jgi:glycolate oxidase